VPIEFEIVYDSGGKLATRYQVEGMPSSYVYGRNGELAARHLGVTQLDAVFPGHEARPERFPGVIG